ncbi:MAG: ABC transporter substrate-binding protein, partial [Acidobacteriota bacterium]
RLLTLGATVANLRGEHSLARRLLEESESLDLTPSTDARGFGDSSAESAPPVRASARSEIASAPEAPLAEASGGELRVALPGQLSSLDPAGASLYEAVETVPLVFETLTRVEEGAHTVPWLAERVTTLEGGRRFALELRRARFHDGRPLTARDVRWSFERLLRSPRPASHHLLLPIRGARALRDGEAEGLAGLKVLSKSRLEIELENSLPLFPTLLSNPLTAVLPEGTAELGGSWRAGAAGTGPFRVLHFAAGSRLELERNPDSWRQGAPAAERLTFTFGLSAREIAKRYREGRLSLASDLEPADVEALRHDPQLASGYREQPRLATYFLALNVHHGPLRDLETRRRLIEALAPDAGLVSAAGRLAMPAFGLIPPGLLGAASSPPPRAAAEPRGRTSDPSRARALQAVLHPVFSGPYAEFWKSVQERAERSDLHLGAEVLSPEHATERARVGSADLIAFRWVADYPDTEGFVGNLLHSEEGFLAGVCSQPEVDALLERGRLEIEPGLRHGIYRELESLIADRALLLPLFHEQIYRFCHPSVGGFSFGSTPEVRYDQLFVK